MVRMIQSSILVLSVLLVTACAELVSINQKVGEWAGAMNQQLNADRLETQDSMVSKRDIDTLYVRIKRQFGFATREEILKCDPNVFNHCKWRQAVIEDGHVHERVPGVFYRMADTYDYGKKTYHVDISLDKEGNSTRIYWKVRGSKEFAEDVKAELLKAIK